MNNMIASMRKYDIALCIFMATFIISFVSVIFSLIFGNVLMLFKGIAAMLVSTIVLVFIQIDKNSEKHIIELNECNYKFNGIPPIMLYGISPILTMHQNMCWMMDTMPPRRIDDERW